VTLKMAAKSPEAATVVDLVRKVFNLPEKPQAKSAGGDGEEN
jgi:hypothetical protein